MTKSKTGRAEESICFVCSQAPSVFRSKKLFPTYFSFQQILIELAWQIEREEVAHVKIWCAASPRAKKSIYFFLSKLHLYIYIYILGVNKYNLLFSSTHPNRFGMKKCKRCGSKDDTTASDETIQPVFFFSTNPSLFSSELKKYCLLFWLLHLNKIDKVMCM